MTTMTPPQELAAAYLERFRRDGDSDSRLIDQLCELATSPDTSVALAASRAIFGGVVEFLADRFEPSSCGLYVRFFSRVVDYCRRLPEGKLLDDGLSRFGLHGEQDLLIRADRVRRVVVSEEINKARLKKILVLSRVTLGADVAITSVVLDRMERLSASAEIVLLAAPKTFALLASRGDIQLVRADYQRSGTLLERLNAWISLVQLVEAQLAGLSEGEYLIIDPDSRLTQLGLLPLTKGDQGYHFFESRSYQAERPDPLGELTGRWLNEVFGPDDEPAYPFVELAPQDTLAGVSLRRCTRKPIAAVNLGVGDREAKRVGDPFEKDLLRSLIEEGYRVVLDRGAGDEELQRSKRLTDSLIEDGVTVGGVADYPLDGRGMADVLVWEGSLSGFAGYVSASHLYVGYDSAGGHVAAALGIPVVTVFAGAASDRMIERWRPWGRGYITAVVVHRDSTPAEVLDSVREHIP